MTKQPSALTRANSALRDGRLEEAVWLYSAARRETPGELGKHIDFNLKFLGRTLRGDEKTPIVVGSADSPPTRKQLPSRDVIVVVLGTSLQKAGETARLLSRRADYRIGIVILLTDPTRAPVEAALEQLLDRMDAKYALITSEDAFPGREWLECAYEGLKQHTVDVIYANTGNSGERPAWSNALAPPTLLKKVLLGGRLAEAQAARTPDFLLAEISPAENSITQAETPSNVHVVDSAELQGQNQVQFTHEVCVIMPCIDVEAGKQAARLLLERAGMEADFVVAVDIEKQGFIPTLNQAARCSSATYIVYLAEDAWPGDEWLSTAYERMRSSGSNLLAFNCGKWHGRVAAFGMVVKAWAYSLYGDQVLYEGYQSHRADNELTAVARAQEVFDYAPECVLVEHDTGKDFRGSEREAANFQRTDAKLFRERFETGFDGLVDPEALASLSMEYLDLAQFYANRPTLQIV